jgi:hypothetical protein
MKYQRYSRHNPYMKLHGNKYKNKTVHSDIILKHKNMKTKHGEVLVIGCPMPMIKCRPVRDNIREPATYYI